jgi:hypothetical protein
MMDEHINLDDIKKATVKELFEKLSSNERGLSASEERRQHS